MDIAIWFDCCLLAVLSCHLATENVIKLLFFGLLLHDNTGVGFVVLRTTACLDIGNIEMNFHFTTQRIAKLVSDGSLSDVLTYFITY